MKYRKKPVIIEAFRFQIDDVMPDWFNEKRITNDIITHEDGTCDIKTLEGTMKANFGDYVIKGVQGEVYPCKPDIFEKTYDIVNGYNNLERREHKTMKKQTPSFNLSWTPDELENGGYDDIVNIIKIAKKQNISILITTDGYTLVLEGQFTDSNHTESHYVFVEDGEVVVNNKFVDWDALEKEERDNND